MIKTILVVTLIATGQPPATYREEFDRPSDCWRARWDAFEVYSKAFGYGVYQKDLNFSAPTHEPVEIRVDCVASEKDLLQSN